jgi:hypothetical protein
LRDSAVSFSGRWLRARGQSLRPSHRA